MPRDGDGDGARSCAVSSEGLGPAKAASTAVPQTADEQAQHEATGSRPNPQRKRFIPVASARKRTRLEDAAAPSVSAQGREDTSSRTAGSTAVRTGSHEDIMAGGIVDSDTRVMIDKFAAFIKENGRELEQLTLRKKRDDPDFRFLLEDDSPERLYYEAKLRDLRVPGAPPPRSGARQRAGGGRGPGARARSSRWDAPGLGSAPPKDDRPPRAPIQTPHNIKINDVVDGVKIDASLAAAMHAQQSGGRHLSDYIPQEEMEKLLAQAVARPSAPTRSAGASTSPSQAIDQSAPDASVEGQSDMYEQYRKRMMLGYRYRPNPLNNPRRQYY